MRRGERTCGGSAQDSDERVFPQQVLVQLPGDSRRVQICGARPGVLKSEAWSEGVRPQAVWLHPPPLQREGHVAAHMGPMWQQRCAVVLRTGRVPGGRRQVGRPHGAQSPRSCTAHAAFGFPACPCFPAAHVGHVGHVVISISLSTIINLSSLSTFMTLPTSHVHRLTRLLADEHYIMRWTLRKRGEPSGKLSLPLPAFLGAVTTGGGPDGAGLAAGPVVHWFDLNLFVQSRVLGPRKALWAGYKQPWRQLGHVYGGPPHARFGLHASKALHRKFRSF